MGLLSIISHSISQPFLFLFGQRYLWTMREAGSLHLQRRLAASWLRDTGMECASWKNLHAASYLPSGATLCPDGG